MKAVEQVLTGLGTRLRFHSTSTLGQIASVRTRREWHLSGGTLESASGAVLTFGNLTAFTSAMGGGLNR
jgi:hypothetical protein